jgi:Adenosine deaminase
MADIHETGIVFELSPTSNRLTEVLSDEDAVRDTSRLRRARRPFTIATDGPQMMRTHLRGEFELLLKSAPSTRSSWARRTGAGTWRASYGVT